MWIKNFRTPLLVGISVTSLLAAGIYVAYWSYQHPDYWQTLTAEGAGAPDGLLMVDLDGNGLKDVVAVSHGGNIGSVHLQTPPRRYRLADVTAEVGFHPWRLLTWPETGDLLEAAEGEGEIRKFHWTPEEGLALTGQLKEGRPGDLKRFNWPGWGDGLVVSPYLKDELVFYKQFAIDNLAAVERLVFPMSAHRPSLLIPGAVKVLDADGDGIDELYYTLGIIRQVRRIVYPGPDKAPASSELVAYLPAGHPEQILSADLDEDGDTDLVVPESMPGGWLHVLLNDGHGHFSVETPPNPFGSQEWQSFGLARDHDGHNVLLLWGTRQLSLMRLPRSWPASQDDLMALTLPKQQSEAALVAVLEDLDNDGWLDAALGRDGAENAAWIIYGPLWENISEMVARGISLH